MPDTEGFLGIDIGGTKVAFRIEGRGARADEAAFPWPARGDLNADLVWLAGLARAARRRSGPGLRSVGVALPATLDPGGRVLAWPSRPEWVGLDAGDRLRALFPGLPVSWADDGALGALAEARAAGCDDVLYLGVGTGVGGGLVLGGAPFPPPGRGAFEIGHTIVADGGPVCLCGRRGCLQALASGPATLERAARLRGSPVTFAQLCSGVRDGADWALVPVGQSGQAIAAAVASVGDLMHPALTILGGGFAAGVPGFLDHVAQRTRELARPGFPAAPVRAAAWNGLSSLRGAVWLARSAAESIPVPPAPPARSTPPNRPKETP